MLVVNKHFIPPDAAAVKQQFKSFLFNTGVSAVTAVAVAFAVMKVAHFRANGETGARVWFYNQKSNRLYPASRSLISPDGNDEARVRAIMIGFQGMGNDPSQLRIAYLEKFSPDFKALLERAEAAHAALRPFTEIIPPPDSAYYQANTLVKRPGEEAWHSAGAEEGRQIMAEWREWRGPDGQRPIISVPPIQ
jgi:hypothetical protein